jgi:RNA recognition motif-containing protein
LKINSRVGKGKKIGKSPPKSNLQNQRGGLVITTDASGKRTISTGKTIKTSPPPRHSPPKHSQRTSKTLQIRNLNTKVTEADLHLSLNKYGDVERVVLIRRVDPRRDESVSTGVAEVVFKSSTSATRAKDELDGKTVDGQRISCRFMGEEPLSFVGRAQKVPLESHSLKNRKKGNMAMDID